MPDSITRIRNIWARDAEIEKQTREQLRARYRANYDKDPNINPINKLLHVGVQAGTAYVTSGGNPLAAVASGVQAAVSPEKDFKPLQAIQTGAGQGMSVAGAAGPGADAGTTLKALTNPENMQTNLQAISAFVQPERAMAAAEQIGKFQKEAKEKKIALHEKYTPESLLKYGKSGNPNDLELIDTKYKNADLELKKADLELKKKDTDIKAYEAQTHRITANKTKATTDKNIPPWPTLVKDIAQLAKDSVQEPAMLGLSGNPDYPTRYNAAIDFLADSYRDNPELVAKLMKQKKPAAVTPTITTQKKGPGAIEKGIGILKNAAKAMYNPDQDQALPVPLSQQQTSGSGYGVLQQQNPSNIGQNVAGKPVIRVVKTVGGKKVVNINGQLYIQKAIGSDELTPYGGR